MPNIGSEPLHTIMGVDYLTFIYFCIKIISLILSCIFLIISIKKKQVNFKSVYFILALIFAILFLFPLGGIYGVYFPDIKPIEWIVYEL